MWFIGDGVDDSLGAGSAIDDDITKTNESMSTSPEQDAEGIIWSVDKDTKLPLPCPCSEGTLGSLTLSESRQSYQKLLYSSPSLVSLSRLKNHEHRSKKPTIAREIVRGAVAGSAISFIFVTTLLVFMPDSSTVRWIQSVHNTVMREAHLGSRHNSIRRYLSIPNFKERISTEANDDVIRGGEIFQQQPDGSHIYHRNGKIRAMINPSSDPESHLTEKKNHRRRSLQELYYSDTYKDAGNLIKYDSSSESQSKSAPPEEDDPPKDPQLVIAGKMTVEDGSCNVAQLNLKTGRWSLRQRIQLSLYNSYSGGEVYSLLANHSIVTNSNAKEYSAHGESGYDASTQPHVMDKNFGGNLIVVGAFDTTYRNSQTTYCSVGKWDGSELSKIGEGLCNSALSKGMKITSAAIAGPNNLYVGGSFQTQVCRDLKPQQSGRGPSRLRSGRT